MRGAAADLRVGAWFVDEAGEGGADGEVFNVTKGVDADASGTVDDEQAWRAAQPIAAHRNWRCNARRVGVHSHRKSNLILVKEGFQ